MRLGCGWKCTTEAGNQTATFVRVRKVLVAILGVICLVRKLICACRLGLGGVHYTRDRERERERERATSTVR